MDLKQDFIVLTLIALALMIPALMILSLKSETDILKGQIDSHQEFIDLQKEWNGTSHDTTLDTRVDKLEQKVYQGYDETSR